MIFQFNSLSHSSDSQLALAVALIKPYKTSWQVVFEKFALEVCMNVVNCYEWYRVNFFLCSGIFSVTEATFSVEHTGRVRSQDGSSTNITILRTIFYFSFLQTLHCLSRRLTTMDISFECFTTF